MSLRGEVFAAGRVLVARSGCFALYCSMSQDNQIPKVRFCDLDCDVNVHVYDSTGAAALELFHPEEGPVATATVNIPEITLEDDEVLIKDYSENEGMAAAFEAAGLGTVTNTHRLSFGSEVKVMKVTNRALLDEIASKTMGNGMEM
jgi:hypothetical protein